MLDSVGLFDRLFAYYEDTPDQSWRSTRRVADVAVPTLRVEHAFGRRGQPARGFFHPDRRNWWLTAVSGTEPRLGRWCVERSDARSEYAPGQHRPVGSWPSPAVAAAALGMGPDRGRPHRRGPSPKPSGGRPDRDAAHRPCRQGRFQPCPHRVSSPVAAVGSCLPVALDVTPAAGGGTATAGGDEGTVTAGRVPGRLAAAGPRRARPAPVVGRRRRSGGHPGRGGRSPGWPHRRSHSRDGPISVATTTRIGLARPGRTAGRLAVVVTLAGGGPSGVSSPTTPAGDPGGGSRCRRSGRLCGDDRCSPSLSSVAESGRRCRRSGRDRGHSTGRPQTDDHVLPPSRPDPPPLGRRPRIRSVLLGRPLPVLHFETESGSGDVDRHRHDRGRPTPPGPPPRAGRCRLGGRGRRLRWRVQRHRIHLRLEPTAPVLVRVRRRREPGQVAGARDRRREGPDAGSAEAGRSGTAPCGWSGTGYEVQPGAGDAVGAKVVTVRRRAPSGHCGLDPGGGGGNPPPFGIRTRDVWGARAPAVDQLRQHGQAAVVHHSDSGSNYGPGDVPASSAPSRRSTWTVEAGPTSPTTATVVDKFGTVEGGRGGGIDRPVIGARDGLQHRFGGVMVIGDYTQATLTAAALERLDRHRLEDGPAPRRSRRHGRLHLREVPPVPGRSAAALPARVVGHGDVGQTSCPGSIANPLGSHPPSRPGVATWIRTTSVPVGSLDSLDGGRDGDGSGLGKGPLDGDRTAGGVDGRSVVEDGDRETGRPTWRRSIRPTEARPGSRRRCPGCPRASRWRA